MYPKKKKKDKDKEKEKEKEKDSSNDAKENTKDKDKKKSKLKTFLISGTSFQVEEKYELMKQIGLGAYGVVCSCLDKKKNLKVAVKKVPNAFEDLVDAKRIVREIKLLNFFDHENIISLVDVPKPESRTGFNDIYIITDLMETDLHRVIYSRQVSTQHNLIGIN
jgi:mitogen-activated protein kinase 1/3